MIHSMLVDLQSRGHDVLVAARDVFGDYEFEGIDVVRAWPDRALAEPYRWCDISITHLDVTRVAMNWARTARKPLAHLIHNHQQLQFHHVSEQRAQLLILNSEWLQEYYGNWKGKTVLVRPPVFVDEYRVKPGNHITLINLNDAKGGRVFWKLAKALPKHKFYGVKGAYGHQEYSGPMKNVTVIENTSNIQAVYRQTRVLIMPSSYESYGRVAIEAIASGIPVIAAPTPGLQESLGDAAMFVDRDDFGSWVRTIKSLDDRRVYEHWSKKALARSAQLDPTNDLDALEAALLEVGDPKGETGSTLSQALFADG